MLKAFILGGVFLVFIAETEIFSFVKAGMCES